MERDGSAAFLKGARIVGEAIPAPTVADAWGAQSVLEDQTVGTLVGHLAQAGVWRVDEYLQPEEPSEPLTFQSAASYYGPWPKEFLVVDHRSVRQRSALVGAEGPAAVVEEMAARVASVEQKLRGIDMDRRLAVFAGAVMRLGDYLETRIVEQVVHLYDLAASVGVDMWPVPDECVAITMAVGVNV
jgi:hypothetical protein